MSDEIKKAVSPFKRDGWAGPFAWEPPTTRHRYFQDGKEKTGAEVDMSREYRVEDYHVEAEKKSQWIDRARMAWPSLQVLGDGQFYFTSKCEGVVHLFATADEARACHCGAGANCDPIRDNHFRGKIKPLPPFRRPGEWERD